MKFSQSIMRFITSILLVPIFVILVLSNKVIFTGLLLLILIISLIEFINMNRQKKSPFLVSVGFLIICTSIISAYFLIGDTLASKVIFLWIVFTCVASDMGGYYFGKNFGKKMLTKISPNKTYVGCLGSFFSSLIPILFLSLFKFNIDIINISTKTLFLCILFSLFCQIGDLFFSYFKRINNAKDYGKILPGHGGLLDRIDGMLFVILLSTILKHFKFI